MDGTQDFLYSFETEQLHLLCSASRPVLLQETSITTENQK